MNDNKNIIGIDSASYLRRFAAIQRHYLGQHKAIARAAADKMKPGAEAQRVYKEGRA
jgi:hypothetical protein